MAVAVKGVFSAQQSELSCAFNMSFHIVTQATLNCPQCEAFYLPFEPHLPCPQCSTPSVEFYDFVSEAVAGLRIHKREYGQYTPAAFAVLSFADHVFLLLCNAFDYIDGKIDFRNALKEYFDRVNWGDQEYLHAHVYDVAIRVREKLTK